MKNLKKHCSLTVILFVLTVTAFSQSADLYPSRFTSIARMLPKQILPEGKRTYHVYETNGTGIDLNLKNEIKVNGFTPVDNNEVVKMIIAYPSEISISSVEVENIVDPATASSGGKLYTAKRTVQTDGKITVQCTDADYKHYDLQPFKRTFYTKQYNNETQARQEAINSEIAWLQAGKDEFKKFVVSKANFKINVQYGYSAITSKVKLWRLESEKHPEFENFKNNCELVKTIFADVNQEVIPADIRTKLQPVISYFESLPKLFADSDKKHKKIRYAAYYNLMKIYFHIDDFETASKYASLLVENDYDEKDGKKFLEEIAETKEIMQKFNLTTMHFKMGEEKGYSVYKNE